MRAEVTQRLYPLMMRASSVWRMASACGLRRLGAPGAALALGLCLAAPAGAVILPSGSVGSFDFDSFLPGPGVTAGDLTVDDGDPLTGEGPNVEIEIGVAATPTSGSLTVNGGSTLRAGGIRVANPQGSIGSTTVTGAGTRLELIGRSINRMEIGSGGTGSMVVEQGAVVDAASDPGACDPGCNNFVGNAAGSNGALTIRDPGSRVDAVNFFGVAGGAVFDIAHDGFNFGVPGGATTATVVVENGGVLSTGSSGLSLGPGGSVPTGTESTDGTVIVRGPGALWTNAGSLDMATGANSTALLQVESQGALDIGGFSVFGRVGAATVALASGASLATRGVDLGGGAGSSADMTMTGATTWENLGRLGIGGAAGGSGKLVIDGAGTVFRSLDDPASPFSSPVRVGQGGVGGGQGDLTVSGGARLETFFLDIGRSDAAGNRMAITGAGTVVEVSPDNGDAFAPPFQTEAGFARVARNAGDRGELVIDSGALLRIRDTGGLGTPGVPADRRSGPGLQIARQPGSVGKVTVDNATVEITQVDPVTPQDGGPFLQVGRSGGGTLLIRNNALVRMSGDQSVVQVSRGVNGGPVLAHSLLDIRSGGRLEVDAAGGSATLNIGQDDNGDGEVRVAGAGSALTLMNATTVLNVGLAGQGLLNVSDQGVVRAGSVNVNGAGSLGGNGTVAGQLNLNGGQITPGNSPGTLTVDGDFTMNAGTLAIEIGGRLAGEFDVLDVSGTASYIAGQILFDFIGGFAPLVGDTFTFLTSSAVSGFGAAATSATGLAPGLGFQVNVGAADLTLEIVAAASGVPEPASAALLALGLGGLWARRRRAGRGSRRIPVRAGWALRRIAGSAVALLCLSLAATSASAYLVQAVGEISDGSRIVLSGGTLELDGRTALCTTAGDPPCSDVTGSLTAGAGPNTTEASAFASADLATGTIVTRGRVEHLGTTGGGGRSFASGTLQDTVFIDVSAIPVGVPFDVGIAAAVTIDTNFGGNPPVFVRLTRLGEIGINSGTPRPIVTFDGQPFSTNPNARLSQVVVRGQSGFLIQGFPFVDSGVPPFLRSQRFVLEHIFPNLLKLQGPQFDVLSLQFFYEFDLLTSGDFSAGLEFLTSATLQLSLDLPTGAFLTGSGSGVTLTATAAPAGGGPGTGAGGPGTAVGEPATSMLLGFSVFGLGLARRRRARRISQTHPVREAVL